MEIKYIKDKLISRADRMAMVKCIILMDRCLLASLRKGSRRDLAILYGKMDHFIKVT